MTPCGWYAVKQKQKQKHELIIINLNQYIRSSSIVQWEYCGIKLLKPILTHLKIHNTYSINSTNIYIYIYVCVCVCVLGAVGQ